MNRRWLLGAASAALAAPTLLSLVRPGSSWAQGVDVKAVLHDPEAPEAGNPKGDVTIVSYFDYNCPFCKQSEPHLKKLVTTDGKIRLIYKDWPILTDASMYGARMALAAKQQGKYQEAHDALLAIPGRRIPKDKMLEALASTSIDIKRLEEDFKVHSAAITALIRRNMAQADAMGLQGTPAFLVGPFKIAQALDYAGFKDAVAQARAQQKS
ncbi:DsbA family protein [Enterovirga sp. CN4-39]|uniref:DsbA family protein n=1 Tax=Enterovirga sp. CN4-39 TaxID=3400910 RepID=UPI003C0469A0